jgi:MerR family transcriptional regulator/heat shock protein HspR
MVSVSEARRRHEGGGEMSQPEAKVLLISVAARLAGMHPQTLRQYDRLGLVQPERTPGGGRRYSARDVLLLREVQRLSQEDGVNLAGIKRIIELEQWAADLQQRVADLEHALAEAHQLLADAHAAAHAAAAAGFPRGDLVPVSRTQRAVVVWRNS